MKKKIKNIKYAIKQNYKRGEERKKNCKSIRAMRQKRDLRKLASTQSNNRFAIYHQ